MRMRGKLSIPIESNYNCVFCFEKTADVLKAACLCYKVIHTMTACVSYGKIEFERDGLGGVWNKNTYYGDKHTKWSINISYKNFGRLFMFCLLIYVPPEVEGKLCVLFLVGAYFRDDSFYNMYCISCHELMASFFVWFFGMMNYSLWPSFFF